MKFSSLTLFFLATTVQIGPGHGQTDKTVGTNLGGGTITRTDVQNRADLAYDIREMYENLSQGDFNQARIVYNVGKHSLKYDKDGNELEYKRSLAKMSTDASSGKFDAEPTFLFQVYGLAALNEEKISQNYLYGDQLVRSYLDDVNSGTMAAEAAVVLNLWMYATHELWDGLNDCALAASGANVQVLGLKDNGAGSHSIDEFMAFWIGSDQTPATADGHSLYALTQTAGALFGKNSPEAQVNTDMKQLYELSAAALSFDDACTIGSNTVSKLYTINNRIISRMYIPLMQMLIHSMKTNDQPRVRLYAKALIPQMSMCRMSTYLRLKESLLDRQYNQNKFLEILGDLQSMYDCLGFSCEDIGAYKVNEVPICVGYPENYPLAEYSPTSRVHQHGKIDLDIHQIKSLMKLQSWTYAKYLYQWGKNSVRHRDDESDPYNVRSLQEMATSKLREKANYYNDFVNYHDDSRYADTAIIKSLDAGDKWRLNPKQRAEYIAKTIQYQVVYMYVMAEMADALADCKTKDATDGNDGSVHAWDEVAAYYIGSLEGRGPGGSDYFDDGQLQWNLGNKRCFQFGTQNAEEYAKINADIEDLLYAGKGMLDGYDCTNLQSTVRKIEHLSLIPIIQSVLRYAIKNVDHPPNSDVKDLAEGEAFALSILPLVESKNKEAADIIKRNMIVEQNLKQVVDGPQAVADAFYEILDDFGLRCHLVGATDEVDPCRLYRGSSVQSDESGATSAMLGGGGLASLVVSVLVGVTLTLMQ